MISNITSHRTSPYLSIISFHNVPKYLGYWLANLESYNLHNCLPQTTRVLVPEYIKKIKINHQSNKMSNVPTTANRQSTVTCAIWKWIDVWRCESKRLIDDVYNILNNLKPKHDIYNFGGLITKIIDLDSQIWYLSASSNSWNHKKFKIYHVL